MSFSRELMFNFCLERFGVYDKPHLQLITCRESHPNSTHFSVYLVERATTNIYQATSGLTRNFNTYTANMSTINNYVTISEKSSKKTCITLIQFNPFVNDNTVNLINAYKKFFETGACKTITEISPLTKNKYFC